MENQNHEHQHHQRKKRKLLKNPWQISTIVLGVVIVTLLVIFFLGGANNKVISKENAGEKLVGFLNKQTQGGVEYVSAKDIGNLYEITVSYKSQEMPVYITKDGEYFVQGAVPLSTDKSTNKSNQQQSSSQTSADIPKSDKPVVELFVMSFCPYGTQMEKGMIPVVRKLGDKIDFEIKFVNYAMHTSKGEVGEELNQYCIQKEQNDKYLDYLSCFLEKGDGKTCLNKIKIDTSKLKICTDKTDKEFDVTKNLEDKSSWASGKFPKFMIYNEDNKKYGVKGSPTLIINGQQVKTGRDAQSILNTICGAFTNSPEECNTDMTSFGTPTPGFGYGTQGGSATSAGCGA